jgi:hypothetical protein
MIKAILLAIVLGAVYFLWKAVTEQKGQIEAQEAAKAEAETATERAAETAQCPVCQNYVAVTAEGGCGREDCPIPALAEAMAEQAGAEAEGSAETPPGPAGKHPLA